MQPQKVGRDSKATRNGFYQLVLEPFGFAAAEAVLLAVVLIGISLAVGSVLVPAAKNAAKRLHSELAGGTKTKG